MALLLLPKLGVGNAAAFANNFTVTKDGSPWTGGGADTFGATTGVQLGTGPTYPGTTNQNWVMVGGTSYVAADSSSSSSSSSLASLAVELGCYGGWVKPGIFAMEVELGYQPSPGIDMRFACNTGYDNGSPSGTQTKTITVGSNTYELKTFWTTYGTKDANTNSETQITVTIVPFLASQNTAGANPSSYAGTSDDRDYRLSNIQRGATMYIQWGKCTVDAVQTWIAADLVESNEFANTQHARIQLRTPPVAVGGVDLRGTIYMGAQGRQPGPPNHKAATVLRAWKNIYQGGSGTIQGTVTIENIPGARQVRLFDKRTGLVIGETWSTVTGHYEFNNINPTREYFVVAHDHLRVYNAVVQDMLTP
jgi:hypothetical protein